MLHPVSCTLRILGGQANAVFQKSSLLTIASFPAIELSQHQQSLYLFDLPPLQYLHFRLIINAQNQVLLCSAKEPNKFLKRTTHQQLFIAPYQLAQNEAYVWYLHAEPHLWKLLAEQMVRLTQSTTRLPQRTLSGKVL